MMVRRVLGSFRISREMVGWISPSCTRKERVMVVFYLLVVHIMLAFLGYTLSM